MTKTDTDAPPAGTRRRPSPETPAPPADEGEPLVPDAGPGEEAPVSSEDAPPVFLSQTVHRMGRRRTRVLAVLSLFLAFGATAVIVNGFLGPEPPTPIEEATGGAWSALTELSDGLRALRPDADLSPLRAKARNARKEVQAAGARVKTLELPISETPLRGRVIRALRADDAWIDAVGSTLANPRSSRRGDLSRLAKRAAVATSLVGGDVDGAQGSVGGTGRLLSATRRGG